MKTVTFVSDFEMYGGVETVFLIYIKELVRRYHCQLISTSLIPDCIVSFCKENNIVCRSLFVPKKRGFIGCFLYKIKKHKIKAQAVRLCRKSDLLIDFKNGAARSLIKWMNNSDQPPKILWIHGGMPFIEERMQFDWSVYDKIVVLTETLKSELALKYPRYKDKLVHIYNPLDFDHVRLSAIEEIEIDSPYFVHISRIEVDKDIGTVIDAYDLYYQKTHTKTKMYFIGDGSEKHKWERYAATKKSCNQILFLGKKENPFPYMKHAKAVMLSSLSEGLGCVLLEGLACSEGVVVSSDCPEGPREILMNGACGLLFPMKDSLRLCDILADIDSGKIIRNQFEPQIDISLKRFEADTVMQRVYSLFKEVTHEY